MNLQSEINYRHTPFGKVSLSTNGVIISADRFFTELIQTKPELLVNTSFSKIIKNNDLETFSHFLNFLLNSKDICQTDLHLLTSNDKIISVHVFGKAAFDADGVIKGYFLELFSYPNINNKSVINFDLHAQKMIQLGLYSSKTGHEFNNFLSAVSGYNMLAMRLLENHPAMKYLDQINIAVERAKEHTNQLLELNKHYKQPNTVFSFRKLINECIQISDINTPIQLETSDYDSANNVLLRMDKFIISQLLLSLLRLIPKYKTTNLIIGLSPKTSPINDDRVYLPLKDQKFVCADFHYQGMNITTEVIEQIFAKKPTLSNVELFDFLFIKNVIEKTFGQFKIIQNADNSTLIRIYLPAEIAKKE